MEPQTPRERYAHSNNILLRQLLVLFCISAAVFITLAATAPNWTDGGGFPTATPTNTQIPPTNTLLPYPSPTTTSIPYPYPGLLNVNPLAVLTPTPTPTPKGGLTLASLCWPFAITFILVVIIASTVFIRGKS